MDPATAKALRELAAERGGLPEELAGRLVGDDIEALEVDAVRLATGLGFRSPDAGRERDERRRFSPSRSMSDAIRERARRGTGQVAGSTRSMSDELRRVAGRTVASDEPPTVGDIGIGRGNTASPPKAQPPDMTRLIRGAVQGRRSAAHQAAEQIATERGHA